MLSNMSEHTSENVHFGLGELGASDAGNGDQLSTQNVAADNLSLRSLNSNSSNDSLADTDTNSSSTESV